MNSSNEKFFHIITVLCFLLICSLFFSPHFNKKNSELFRIGNDPGRNEGSTPRTFVLPANPAVAKEQERKQGLMLKKNEIQRCMLKLYDLGYQNLGSFDYYFSFKITQSIIEYQIKEGTGVTGIFDKNTKNKLGCL